ncbi:hypothetical protein FVEN_g12873 [Fusarium venenatum]|nr:hypothetical protein FVEN_g12873 [Fusarium venenatum]
MKSPRDRTAYKIIIDPQNDRVETFDVPAAICAVYHIDRASEG